MGGAITNDAAGDAGDNSRAIAGLAKSCVRTSSAGVPPLCGSRPEDFVSGIGEIPPLDIGGPVPNGRVRGNEMLGLTLIFSLLPPNLNKPCRLGLRSDEVEVEVGREVGIEISLERDEFVVLWASSPSYAAASASGMVRETYVVGGEVFGLALRFALGGGLEGGEFGETEGTGGLGVGIGGGGVALVVANLAAIGGKTTVDVAAASGLELEPEPEPEERGIDEADTDNRKGVTGIGGTTGVGFDFRLKNDPDFFGLPASEPVSDLDFDDALVFLTEEKDAASERYAPSLPPSVSYSVTSPLIGDFDLSLSFFSLLLLLFFILSSFFASFAAALASFSASFVALASISRLIFSHSFLLFTSSLALPSLS